MQFEEVLRHLDKNISALDAEIGKAILANKQDMPNMSINELAKRSFVSKSSILRFTQKLGFKGYTEFKLFIDWHEGPTTDRDELLQSTAISDFFHDLILGLEHRPDLTQLFAQLQQARRVFLIGASTDQHIQAEHLAKQFMKLGVIMTIIDSAPYSAFSASIVESTTADDLIIAFSNSGDNDSLIDMLTIPLMQHVPIVSFTYSAHNWLRSHSVTNFTVDSSSGEQVVFYESGIFLIIDYLSQRYKQYLEQQFA